MELMVNISQYFLLTLMFGMSFYSLLADTKLTGVGFYKVVLGITGGSSLISFIIHLWTVDFFSLLTVSYLVLFLVLLVMFNAHEDKRSKAMWALYFFKMILIVFISYFFMENNLKHFIFFMSSMGLLGAVTFTMVLGHWYLVTPKLTEKPLAIGVKIMWAIILGKMILTFYGYYQSSNFFGQNTQVGMGYSFNWIMLIMRVLWGYGVIIVMSYFAYRLIKMRSLQSATGILYAMTFFVFIGEMISTYLFYNYGLML